MINQMGTWVPSFVHAIKDHTSKEPFVTFSIATVDAETGRPRNRTVILRDFLFHNKRTNVLTFSTDLRTEKCKEFAKNAAYEACFYFPNSREQYRFSGNAFLVTSDSLPNITNPYTGETQVLNPDNKMTVTYPIISPTLLNPIRKTTSGSSSPSLDEIVEGLSTTNVSTNDDDEDLVLTEEDFTLPTEQEWQAEIIRQWNNLSRTGKNIYKKPQPRSPMDDEKQKKIDKISRGVDGAGSDAGLKNFGLVVMCVDNVDLLQLKRGLGGQRMLVSREDTDLWEEYEVCP